MKNSKLRRALMLLACAVLLVSLSVGATLAYLTSVTPVVTNTFTVGNVEILLDEQYVDVYGKPETRMEEDEEGNENEVSRGTENTYKLLPGHKYMKDPTVTLLDGSEDCYVFVKVTNDIAEIELEGATSIYEQMTGEGRFGWIPVEGAENIFVLGWPLSLKEGGVKAATVFDSFTIDPNVTDEELAEKYKTGKTITITAYAIQVDGFADRFAAEDYATIWNALADQDLN